MSGPPYGYEYPCGSFDPSGLGSASGSAPAALRCSVIRAAAWAPARYAATAPARAAAFRSGRSPGVPGVAAAPVALGTPCPLEAPEAPEAVAAPGVPDSPAPKASGPLAESGLMWSR